MAWTTPRTWVSGELVTAALMNSAVRDNELILKTAINDSGQIEFTDATELTISSGVITVTQNYHMIDTQGDASSDDLDTITAGTDVAAGFILHLRVVSDARTVVIKAGTSGSDNLDIGSDVTLDESYKTYSLVYDGDDWRPWSYAAAATFAGISPLTTRGDILYSSSGTVTGTRLAVGAANTVLGSDGTDTAWQLKPLTTRGDILYGSSGVPTGTRLAVGGANTFLKSDGTDVAWAAASGSVVGYTATTAAVSNSTVKTAVVTVGQIAADDWDDGDFLQINLTALLFNNTGSSRTVTWEVDIEGNVNTNTKVWEAGANIRYQWWQLNMIRAGAEVWWPFANHMIGSGGMNPGDGSDKRITSMDFTAAIDVKLNLTLPTASASLYITPQSANVILIKRTT